MSSTLFSEEYQPGAATRRGRLKFTDFKCTLPFHFTPPPYFLYENIKFFIQITEDIYNLFHGSVIFINIYVLKESRNSQEFVENKP